LGVIEAGTQAMALLESGLRSRDIRACAGDGAAAAPARRAAWIDPVRALRWE